MILEMNDKQAGLSASPRFELRYLPNKSPERNNCAMADPSDPALKYFHLHTRPYGRINTYGLKLKYAFIRVLFDQH